MGLNSRELAEIGGWYRTFENEVLLFIRSQRSAVYWEVVLYYDFYRTLFHNFVFVQVAVINSREFGPEFGAICTLDVSLDGDKVICGTTGGHVAICGIGS